jgi:hypothetical protein
MSRKRVKTAIGLRNCLSSLGNRYGFWNGRQKDSGRIHLAPGATVNLSAFGPILGHIRHALTRRVGIIWSTTQATRWTSLFSYRKSTEHCAKLLEQSDKLRVELREDILVAHNLGQIPGTDGTCAAWLTIRIDRPPSEKRCDGSIITAASRARPVDAAFLTSFLHFLEPLGGIDDPCGDAAKHSPDHWACAKGPASIFAGERNERVAPAFAPGRRVRKAEDIGDRIARDCVAER